MRHIIASTAVVILFAVLCSSSMAGTLHRMDVISGRPRLRTRTVGFYHRAAPTQAMHKS